MKHNTNKIGKQGIKWESVERPIAKDDKKIQLHYKKTEFK